MWAFEQFDIVPDILLLGKALGGGMPLGAFIAEKNLMHQLSFNPVLGHITTFGGHPVSCAAGKAAFEVLLEGDYITEVKNKETLLLSQLQHPFIKKINHFGLWVSLKFQSEEIAQNIIHHCINKGCITDWFLFAPDALRIAPPLIITQEEILQACDIILSCISEENNENN